MQDYIHKVQYYETDKMAVVHHSNYIRWFEEARVHWLEQIGCPMQEIEAADAISPVMSVTCNYHSMVRFGDEVVVKLNVETFNGIKLEIGYEIVDKVTGELRTTGNSTHCFIDGKGNLLSLKKHRPEIYETLKNVC